jgi:hypothetical protein
MNEDAAELRGGRRALDELQMCRGPYRRIDTERIFQHRHGDFILALFFGEDPIRHRCQPDIRIEADLVAGMSGQHRPAARLRQIADKKARPAIFLARFLRQLLEIGDEAGMAEIAVARQAHHLPGGTVDGKRDAACQAPLVVGADGARSERCGLGDRAEQHLGGRALRRGLLLCRSLWSRLGG